MYGLLGTAQVVAETAPSGIVTDVAGVLCALTGNHSIAVTVNRDRLGVAGHILARRHTVIIGILVNVIATLAQDGTIGDIDRECRCIGSPIGRDGAILLKSHGNRVAGIVERSQRAVEGNIAVLIDNEVLAVGEVGCRSHLDIIGVGQFCDGAGGRDVQRLQVIARQVVLAEVVDVVPNLVALLVEREFCSLNLAVLVAVGEAIQFEEVLTIDNALRGQLVEGVLVGHRQEVAVVVEFLVNLEVALVVVKTEREEVLITRDEHIVKVTPSEEGAIRVVNGIVGGIGGPAFHTVNDGVTIGILGNRVGIGGVGARVEQTAFSLGHGNGVTLLVIDEDPQLIGLVDIKVEDTAQRRLPVAGHIVVTVVGRVVIHGNSVGSQGDVVQTYLGLVLRLVVTIACLATIVGDVENQVGQRLGLGTGFARH